MKAGQLLTLKVLIHLRSAVVRHPEKKTGWDLMSHFYSLSMKQEFCGMQCVTCLRIVTKWNCINLKV